MSNQETMRPCPHMKTLLSALADDSLTGIARWFARNHTRGCPRCAQTLASIKTLRERVRTLGVPERETLRLPEDRWATIEAAWQETDQQGKT